MSSSRVFLLLALAAGAMAVSPAHAQQRGKEQIGYVYPAGGRQGTTFQVTVGGQLLDGASGLSISGSGIQATVAELVKPLSMKQIEALREQIKDLVQRRNAALAGGQKQSPRPTWTAEDGKLLAELLEKASKAVRKPLNPAIAETVTFLVTIAPNAEPGTREIRLATPRGLTNPLAFCVGQLPEFAETPAKTAGEQKGNGGNKYGYLLKKNARPTETQITLPAVANGQILPGAVDHFRFTGRKGQRLVAAVSARQLIPYLADAVPGWFQATLALYDAGGKELAYNDDFRFNPDPLLYYEIPADGEYVLEIKDAIYRGREDFVYRITVGELPFVTGIFPLGGPAGAETRVELQGWNLPATSLVVDNRSRAPGIYPLTVQSGQWVSNVVPFAVGSLGECLEKEPNNGPSNAQPVTLPIIVNGRVDPAEDTDVFCFAGKAGQRIVAEVYARRLNSPLDSQLKLTDAAGKELAANDDFEDKAAGLITHQADSWLCATLPADGKYYLHLRDAQHKGGPEYAYRLRIGPPQGDFDLRIVPSSINARAGSTVPITVYAIRRDGFSGDINLALKDAPEGFALRDARVPGNKEQVELSLTVPSVPNKGPLTLHVEGHATIDGHDVCHPAVPAENMMQAFDYHHLVPVQELKVAVGERISGKAFVKLKVLSRTPVAIPAGGTARVEVAMPQALLSEKVVLKLSDPPAGITLAGVLPFGEGGQFTIKSDAAQVKTGLKGNLVVTAAARNPAKLGKPKAAEYLRNLRLTIPFEIVSP
jgi:hypothetical protein